MEITVFPSRNIGRIDGKNRFRHQKLAIGFAVRDHLDPFDVMLFFHGMDKAADLYLYAV
jgi:hypothetical protein